eukprot:jgi/Astpho2/1218/Aster-x0468
MRTFLLQGHHYSGQAPLLAPVFEAAQPSQRGHELDVLDPSPYYVGAVPHRPDEDHIRQPSGADMGQRMEAAQQAAPPELAPLVSLSQPAEPAVAAPAMPGPDFDGHLQQQDMPAGRQGRQEAQKCRPDRLEPATQGSYSQEQQQGEYVREFEPGTGRERQAQQQMEPDRQGQGTGREHQAQQQQEEPDNHKHVIASRRGRRHARRLQLMLDAAAAMQPAADPNARPDVSGCQHWVSAQALQLLEAPGLQQPPSNSRGGGSALERLIQPPSLLSAFSGCLTEQLWHHHMPHHMHSSEWLADSEQADSEAGTWMSALGEADLPPTQVLMHHSLAEPVQEQIDLVGAELLGRLLGEWGLMRELTVLRNTFLLGSPLLAPFCHSLFTSIARGQVLAGMGEYELDHLLQQSLADTPNQAGGYDVPAPNALRVAPAGAEPGQPTQGARQEVARQAPTVAELLPLRLDYKVSWPLSIVVDDQVLGKYNQILIFLMQMRWANFALQHVRLKAGAGEAGRPLECSDAFLQEMSHFVSNLQQFVMDRLLHGAWLEQQQSLEQATSLEEVTAAHSAFLEAAMRQCLLAPDKTWKLIENAVHRILNLVLQFTTLQRALRQKGLADSVRGVMQQEQVQLHQAFRDRHRYLMKVLTAKTLKISGQSELHNLVTVLNFNDFYRESKF